ncbi:MAG TPA: molecular chaperone SurA, partial [Halieaceae bacterium]|nr:molecular chaperone SurA [Halieaceae bacterium]
MTIKSALLAAGLAATLLLVGQTQAQTQILDQVVAIVDDDVIMASELRERVAAITQSLEARGVEMPPEDVLIRETLDRLILESIQLQLGNRVGARISDAQLNQAMERVAAQNRMSLADFSAALEQQGQSYAAMREQVRREMIIQRVQAGNVNQRIQISEQEVRNFLASP